MTDTSLDTAWLLLWIAADVYDTPELCNEKMHCTATAINLFLPN